MGGVAAKCGSADPRLVNLICRIFPENSIVIIIFK